MSIRVNPSNYNVTVVLAPIHVVVFLVLSLLAIVAWLLWISRLFALVIYYPNSLRLA